MRPLPNVLWLPLISTLLLISGCHMRIDRRHQNNACQFLQDNPMISEALAFNNKNTAEKALTLSIIQHESNHRAHARPVKSWLIKNWVPWTYYSSARGYAQSTDATWSDFKKSQKSTRLHQSSYFDSVWFIRWYFNRHHDAIQTSPMDYHEAYFLYHDGYHGYFQKKYRRSLAMSRYASMVAKDAKRYEKQLERCKEALKWQNAWYRP